MAIHRRLLHVILIILSVLLLLVVAGVFVVRSARFHRYALAQIVEHAEQATGGRVDIGDFTFRRAGLRIDFYRVAVHGNEPVTAPPLLAVDHIGVGLRIISLLHKDITLNDLEIDHPVVHMTVDAHGHSNLPQTPSSSSSSSNNVFQLAVRYVAISNGDVYYNDSETPLDARLQNLEAAVRFVPANTAYQGSLGYQAGMIHFGALNPLNHDLQAQLTATPSGITLNSLKIRSGASWITAQANLTDYSDPAIEGSYQASLSGVEIARILNNPSLPQGILEAQGRLKYQNRPGLPFIEALSSDGSIHSARLAVSTPQARAGIEGFSASYALSQGNLEIPTFKGGLAGGTLTGKASLGHLGGTPAGKVSADIHDLSLEDARRAVRSAPPQAAMLTGRLNASLEASWQGSMQNLQVRSDATIAGATNPNAVASSGAASILVGATVHLAYDGRRQVLTLTNTSLHTPHTTVSADGSLGKRTSLRLNAQSTDLHEIDELALMARSGIPTAPGSQASPPQPLGLAGSASFTGTVQGSLSAPQIAGKLGAANLRYAGANLKTIQGNVNLSPSGAAIHQGSLQDSSGGTAQFDASVGLRDWSFTPQSSMRAQLAAQKFQVGELEKLAHQQYPVSGTLSANVSFSGTETNPGGQGSVQLTSAKAWDQPIQSLTVRFQGSGTGIHSTLTLNTPAGSLTADVTYGLKDQSYNGQIKAPHINLAKLAALADGNAQISGTIAFNASGRGTLKNPQGKAAIEAPQLHVGTQDLSGLRAEAAIADEQAQVTLASTVSGAAIQAQGRVSLTGQHQSHMTVQSQTIQLGPLLTAFVAQAPSGLKGETRIQASLDGPLSAPEQVQAQITIPSFSVSYQSLQIGAAAPIRARYRDGVLTIEHSELRGTDTALQLQGSVPIRAPGVIQVSATGGVDLHLVQLVDSQLDTSGRIDLNVTAQGTRAHPEVKGTVRLSDASVIPAGSPIGLEQANGEIDIANGRAEIKTLTGQVGGGTLTARGFATYSPSVQFNLGLKADGVRLLFNGVRTATSADLTLTGTPASGLLGGQVYIDGLSLTRSFDLANFAGQFSGPSTAVTSSPLEQNIKLNVAVLSREQASVESSQLSVKGSVNLQVRGTVADPVILGRTDIVSGEVFFEGKRFEVQNGVIQFVNPTQTEPDLNLVVTTTVQQFNLTLNFVGPIDRLQTTYTSDPPLSPIDIIDLLVSGHTSEAAQASPTTPQSLLAQGLSSEVSSRAQKLVGISSLTIDPQIGGNQANAPSQLAIQQRVTKNLFFTFATDVTTTNGQVVQVEYQITKKYSISAIRDQTGGYQVEVKMHKVF